MVPSFAWNVTPFSFSSRSSRRTFRSSFQKNRASLRRAVSTRALPLAISLPPSLAAILATAMKWGARFPLAGLRTAKNRWCTRIDVRITSGGSSRKAGSMSPITGTGHSVRPATSSSNPSSSTSSRFRAEHRVRASCRMRSLRSCGSRTTKLSRRPSAYSSKLRAQNAWREPMKRCPSLMSPLTCPSISNGTTSPSKTHRIRCSGRTQRSRLTPEIIDLGQGKLRTILFTISNTTNRVGRPGRCRWANQTPSRSVSWSLVRPFLRRNPSSACSGALVRGPLTSSCRSGWDAARPSATSVSRRGPAKVVSASGSRPSAASFSRARRSKSFAACACMRAGISSENSSIRSWGMTYAFPPCWAT